MDSVYRKTEKSRIAPAFLFFALYVCARSLRRRKSSENCEKTREA